VRGPSDEDNDTFATRLLRDSSSHRVQGEGVEGLSAARAVNHGADWLAARNQSRRMFREELIRARRSP